MSDFVFSLGQLHKYATVTEPGTYAVRCGSTPDYEEGMYTDDGHNRWLVHLRAITQGSIDKIEAFVERAQAAGNVVMFSQISHLLMTGAIWENQIKDRLGLPVKGEMMLVVFDNVKGELRSTNITIMPRIKLKLYSPVEAMLKGLEELDNILITNGNEDEN